MINLLLPGHHTLGALGDGVLWSGSQSVTRVLAQGWDTLDACVCVCAREPEENVSPFGSNIPAVSLMRISLGSILNSLSCTLDTQTGPESCGYHGTLREPLEAH